MQTIQLVISDLEQAEVLEEALLRSGPWQVRRVETPDVSQRSVLVWMRNRSAAYACRCPFRSALC